MAKILIVEDEKMLAQFVDICLKNAGYETILAADGQQALDMVEKDLPDLIVLDIKLPKVDGYKVCETLKQDECYQHIPIIMLTARDSEIEKKTGLAMGAAVYLTKPCQPEILLAKINQLLKR